jgi:hypothetical protein
LATCLGCLPLTISQVASFAKRSHQGLNDVLELYKSEQKFEVRLLFTNSGSSYSYSPSAWEVNQLE